MVSLDPYTLRLRLCDDSGMVSHEEADSFGRRVVVTGQTYLDRFNNLRSHAIRPESERQLVTEPFACTGSAHLAGEHIQCTSPAHDKAQPVVTSELLTAGPTSLTREQARFRIAELFHRHRKDKKMDAYTFAALLLDELRWPSNGTLS